MITCHWKTTEEMEIWSGIKIQAEGQLLIRVHKGSSDLHGTEIVLKDPFEIPIYTETIPQIIKGEYWQITIPQTNYFHQGHYSIFVHNEQGIELFFFEYFLESRKRSTQSFSVEYKIVAKNLKKRVESLKFNITEIPNNFLLQTSGSFTIRGANLENNTIQVTDLFGSTQKTISWAIPVQPTFLPLSTEEIGEYPDEFYIFNSFTYDPQPGLEIDDNRLDNYQGSNNLHYPIKVIKDVLNHVHRNMRYVRQSKERGVKYALKYGRGDCTEYSAFFVTLLRKLGMGARLVSGMSRSFHNNWISHAFAEIFIYGSWVPIDTVKPPKPYLQIGNRGELIGLNRKNWLDQGNQEFRFNFMAMKGVTPKVEVHQKVTESGINSLPLNIHKKPRRKFLKAFNLGERNNSVKLVNGIIDIPTLDSDISSLLIIQGNLEFGKIIQMHAVIDGEPIKLQTRNNIPNGSLLVLLDRNGNVREVNHIV